MSENIVIDRHLLLQSTLTFTVNAGSATNAVNQVPVGQLAMNYGLKDSIQAFPLQSLFTTAQATINNVSVSTNYKDILPMLMRMNDKEMLSRYNTMTPSNADTQYGVYADGVLANNNPLASFNNNSYDDNYMPRGAYPVSIAVQHFDPAGVIYGGAGATSLVSQNIADTWKIVITGTFTEPFLALSPFINSQPMSQAGLVGINNMSMVLNIDSTCARLFSTANTNIAGGVISSYITSINLGSTAQSIGFQNTRLLFNFLSLQPEQYAKISSKNTVGFLDYPRFLTTSTNNAPLAPNASSTITSQSIQLNQIPDLILICARVPMSEQNWNNTSSFLTINKISVNFNNASGLLASSTQNDLYNISYANGSAQSFYEFRGGAINNNNITGSPTTIPTTGSLLVLSPVYNFGLPSYLAGSSLGQYQFQFNLEVSNQLPYNVVPEVCICLVNSGLFSTVQGSSQIFTGILTKEMVLRTKEQNPVPHLTSDEYKRLVGGKLENMGMSRMGRLHHGVRKVGGVPSGGVMSGGQSSGGQVSGGRTRLSKHLM